jgi:hypothetical protein
MKEAEEEEEEEAGVPRTSRRHARHIWTTLSFSFAFLSQYRYPDCSTEGQILDSKFHFLSAQGDKMAGTRKRGNKKSA